jgi:hypothetical protein
MLEICTPTPSHCSGDMSGIKIIQGIAYFDYPDFGRVKVPGNPLRIYKDFRMSITYHTNLL